MTTKGSWTCLQFYTHISTVLKLLFYLSVSVCYCLASLLIADIATENGKIWLESSLWKMRPIMCSEPSRHRQPTQRILLQHLNLCQPSQDFWQVQQLVRLSCFKSFITVHSVLFLGCPIKYLVSAYYFFSCSVFLCKFCSFSRLS